MSNLPRQRKRGRAHDNADLSAYLLPLSAGNFYEPKEVMYMMYSIDHMSRPGDSAHLLNHILENHQVTVTKTVVERRYRKLAAQLPKNGNRPLSVAELHGHMNNVKDWHQFGPRKQRVDNKRIHASITKKLGCVMLLCLQYIASCFQRIANVSVCLLSTFLEVF